MATAEAQEILSSTKNLLNIRDGNLNISFIQDFLTFSFLLTSKDTFFTKNQFTQMFIEATGAIIHLTLPMPALIKPQ